MCFFRSPPKPKPIQMAATDNREAMRQADMEARLRQRRRGAAADVLTAPGGVSMVTRMGEVA